MLSVGREVRRGRHAKQYIGCAWTEKLLIGCASELAGLLLSKRVVFRV
jgi:hypothetical protein